MGKHFVKTSDSETATKLRECGFRELNKEGNLFVFVNENEKLCFSSVDQSKVTYTNSLCI